MGLVAHRTALVVHVEGIRIFHYEFAATQHTGAGPGFVTVFRLDLEQRKWVVLAGRSESGRMSSAPQRRISEACSGESARR